MLGEIGGRGNWKINMARARSCAVNALAPHEVEPLRPDAGAAWSIK